MEIKPDCAQRRGCATAIGHHGELIQGVFADNRGSLHRGLVSLPITKLNSRATFAPSNEAGVRVSPPHKTKALEAARMTLHHLNAAPGGDLVVISNIEIGHGYGSSTADVAASIRAVAAALSVHLDPSTICRLAVAAERASDAVAYQDHAVLFAQREGVVLEHFEGPLPPMLLVGFKANDGQTVDTVGMKPARYEAEDIQLFLVLRATIARGVRFQDPYLIGQAATASARISQRHLPKRNFEAVLTAAESAGACGVQVAHSGSLIGVIFDPSKPKARQGAELVGNDARQLGFRDVEFYLINQWAAQG